MPTKLTRLKCYAFLKEIYLDNPQPNWKKYDIEDLRKATRIWFEWDGENWVKKNTLKNNNMLEHADKSAKDSK